MPKSSAAVLASLAGLSSTFRRDRSGQVAIMVGLFAIPFVGMVGAAIDYSRWASAAYNTRNAMDAAVLAGTRTLVDTGEPADAIATATAFYEESVASRPAIATDTVSFQVNEQATGLKSVGNAWIETPFLSLFSVEQLPLLNKAKAEGSEAKYEQGGGGGSLEISLMLDVTGSMCDNGEGPCTSSVKLNALKAAAKKLVDTVVWEDQSEYTSRVAIVPFSTRVRVEPNNQGGPLMKKLTDLDPTWSGWYNECTASTGGGGSEGGGNWQCTKYTAKQFTGWKLMPCVTERFYDAGWYYDLTDDAPGPGKWLNAHDGRRMTKGYDSSSLSPTAHNYFKNRTGASKSKPADHWNYTRPAWGGGVCSDVAEANIIMPLSSDAAALKSRIDGLEAYGSTAGALGTAWAWYMLSPKWDGVWTGASEPGEYSLLTEIGDNGVAKLRKVAILMTDGVYNTYRGWKDQDQQTVSNAAVSLCNNMKAEGIEVFTVGFALDSLPPAQRSIAEATLQSCGTDIDHFYNTLNVEELTAAFEAIASQVTKSGIVLTK